MKKNYYENIDEDDALFYDDNSYSSIVRRQGFCLPWMIEAISFMMIIASIIVVKSLYRDGHLQKLFDSNGNSNGNRNGSNGNNGSNHTETHANTRIRQWED